jgi:diguanylate cyclase (GGDEF)-like protein/PAS domain S-box-containing protein
VPVDLDVWSRASIGELAQGQLVFQRDALAVTVPLPAWLADAAAGEWAPNASETVELAHPDDRVTVVDSFLTALAEPGVPRRVHVRQYVDGQWSEVEMTWLNQLDNPDVGAQIGMIRVLGPCETPELAVSDIGQGQATNWLLIELDLMNTILSARGPVEATLGYPPGELIGQTLARFLHTGALADTVNDWMAILANPHETRVIRRPFVRIDGSDIWFEASFVHEASGHILCVLIDITDRRAQEREREQLNEQLRVLADSMPTAIARCDGEGRVLYHNTRWGYLTAQSAGTAHLVEIVASAAADELAAALAHAFAATATDHHTVELPGCDDRSTLAITLQPVGEPAPDRIIIVSVADATDTVRLRLAALTDGLTGLLNRSAIEERIIAALDAGDTGTLIAFIDLNRFKVVNDTFGHDAGDTVLRAVASRLRATVRPTDDVARYGGDEFVIVCRDLAGGTEHELIARLHAALDQPVDVAGGQWCPAASIGWSRTEPDDDLGAVLRRADHAMFDAKRAAVHQSSRAS